MIATKKMQKLVLGMGLCALLCLISCQEKDTSFLITDQKIGKLDKSSLVRDLELIYEGDSLVKDSSRYGVNGTPKKIRIYEKGGQHLLTLTPSTDSIPYVENVSIEDARFKTAGNIGLGSTFKEIQDQYEIKKTVTTLKSVVIFPKNSNLYFTIDKSELPENLRYTMDHIDMVQIPNEAKIKYLMAGWENN